MINYAMQGQSLVEELIAHSTQPSGTIIFSEAATKRLYSALAEYLNKTLEKTVGVAGRKLSAEDLIRFIELNRKNPVTSEKGVTNDNTLLWLYALTKFIEPEIVVESGVYHGKSLWLLRQAAPNATIYAFDINLKNLKFRDNSIKFYENDWSTIGITGGPKTLCYFDDHINNCLRIKQAFERKFVHLVFDDSPCTTNLKHFRYPGVPTAQMLLDEWLRDGDELIWIYNDTPVRYIYRESHTREARNIVNFILPLPSLGNFLGRTFNSLHSTYVKLHSS